MRLHDIDSGLFHSYGETGSIRGLDPGGNVYAQQAATKTIGNHVDTAGDENSTDSTGVSNEQDILDAAKELEARLNEQGVHLRFEVVRAESGEMEVEVTDDERSKVLMRIPAKGVLKVNAEGKTVVGNFLNLRS